MSPTTSTPDARASSDEERVALALGALAEVTDPADVGPLVAVLSPGPGVVDLQFACALPGYPDWRWTVSTANLADVPTTVLEVELMPGDGSLLAPAWTPWTERLAEWRRSHPDEEGAGDGGEGEDALGDEDDDEQGTEDGIDPDDGIDDAIVDVDDDELLAAADDPGEYDDEDDDPADDVAEDEDGDLPQAGRPARGD